MMGRLLRLVTLAELAAALVVGNLCAALLRWPWRPFSGALLGVALALAVHGAVVTTYFILAHRDAPLPSARRIGAAAAIRMVLRELAASVRGFNWAHPFREHFRIPAPQPPLQAAQLVFIHGYFCNRAIWRPFVREAARRGFRSTAITLEPAFGSIDQYAPVIEAAVEAAERAAPGAPIVLIGHSMGGLAIRAWMRAHGMHAVARVITLGSPHHGTVLARASSHTNVAQMQRGSAWLRELAGSETPALRARITSLFSYHDNIVRPQETSILEGARNVPLTGIGHVTLVYDRRVWQHVFAELDALGECLASPAPASAAGAALGPALDRA